MPEQEKMELVDGHFVVKGKKPFKAVEPKEMLKNRPAKKEYSEEVIALRDRIIRGNQKLFDAWLQIREMPRSDEKEEQLDRWNEAQDRLHYLCLELQVKGYVDCLYINDKGERTKNCLKNPDDFWCQVCPSDYPYWHKDASIHLFDEKEEDETEE